MRTLIIAPHPDDELLGCGGTLLRRRAEGGNIGWLLMTAATQNDGWAQEFIDGRAKEIVKVREGLGVTPTDFYALGYPTTQLDRIPLAHLVSKISEVFRDFKPEEVLVPYPDDAHSDHRITFEAASACTKWFRHPTIRRILTYETPSETDFCINPNTFGFRPNVFVNISDYIDEKLELLQIYKSELGDFPHPRSKNSVVALAQVRGTQSGFRAAESFALLRELS